MATPAAAAALFQKALPKPTDSGNAVASGSGTGQRARGSGRSNRGGTTRNGGGRARQDNDDTGMSDVGAESGGAKRRGRQGARAGPMGERVSWQGSAGGLATSAATLGGILDHAPSRHLDSETGYEELASSKRDAIRFCSEAAV